MSTQYLLFTLAAPMASFGELAGHERRKSRERPGKSALMGLIGAALGIRREDSEGQSALATHYDCAVRVENPGHPLQDFHTVQSVPTTRIKNPQTRAAALNALTSQDNAILTRREYRMDVLYRIAINAEPSARWPLEEIKAALLEPYYTLYLGRKSCPLSHPLAPHISSAPNIRAALDEDKTWPGESLDVNHRFSNKSNNKPRNLFRPYIAISQVANDEIIKSNPGEQTSARQERVNDQPLNRKTWHFAERYEVIHPVKLKEPGQ